MATIAQHELFSWKEIENLGDLDRLRLVLDYLPDEKLMQRLETERGKGRDDWPIRALWNSVLAGVVYQHSSIESLRRELSRNPQLRWLCGFDVTRPDKQVAPASSYTRLFKKLMSMPEEIDLIFDQLVEDLRAVLPDFGQYLAVDGKAISSRARRAPKQNEQDGRRDNDADYGAKSYWVEKADGSAWKKIKHWFGYKLHLLVDSNYELPVAWRITRASVSEIPQAKELIKETKANHPGILARCEYFSADKGLDDTELNRLLWDDHKIKPLIDIRNCWKDAEKTRRVFTPLARSSYKWKDLYKKRTAVERVNSRLDVSYGFEQHFIRGLPKMRMRMGLAMLVMLSMALGRVKEKQEEQMRSLVAA